MVYFLIIAGIIILDRAVKWIVAGNMAPGETIPVLHDIFHITYVRNSGAAFSMLQEQTLVLVGFPLAVIAAGIVLLVIKRKTWHPALCASIAMICAGGAGNLIDRAMAGYVVDMFDFRVFPVFNVADIAVCAGCGLLLLYILIIDGRKEKKQNQHGE